jgi:hypothetical protein
VAPLRLGGLRGKQITPGVSLGGTGEISLVGKQKRHRAIEAARSEGSGTERGTSSEANKGNGMKLIGEVECTFIFDIFNVIYAVFSLPFVALTV